MPQTTFELIREKYKKAQAEKIKELEKERKELRPWSFWLWIRFTTTWKKQQTVKEADQTIQLREKLRNMLKQTQADEITDKENKEKEF